MNIYNHINSSLSVYIVLALQNTYVKQICKLTTEISFKKYMCISFKS